MAKKSIIKDKSFNFSLSIIKLYSLLNEQKEYVISKQLLRSATSIGANVNEAIAGESRKDFVHKMSIASKEARETLYWLELLNESKLVDLDYSTHVNDCVELIKIITSIVKTTKQNTI